ncbi:MAG: Lrp/AsnC family transcriptional regulator [Pseudomonadota bacterium]|nr:Lrp/AsnC family transcriptional regulator [Pseudomonadota bacterium]
MNDPLSELDKRIILAVEACGSTIPDRIADRIGTKAENVEKSLNAIERQGILGDPHVIVNIALLGMVGHAIFLTLDDKTDKRQIIDFASMIPGVFWVSNISGPYDLIVGFQCEDLAELDEFLGVLHRRFGHEIVRHSIATRLYAQQMPRTHLDPDGQIDADPDRYALFAAGKYPKPFGDLERAVLNHLVARPFAGTTEIADALVIDRDKAGGMIEQLNRSGVIGGVLYNIDLSSCGYTTYQVLYRLRHRPATLDRKLHEFCQAHPHVVFLVKTLGGWDYEISIEIPKSADPGDVMAEIEAAFPELCAVSILKTIRYYEHVGFSGKTGGQRRLEPREATLRDGFFLRRFVREGLIEDESDFSLCPGYIHQACRNGAYAVADDVSVAFVTRKSQDRDAPFVVVTWAGHDMTRFLTDVGKILHARSSKPVIFKNAGPEMERKLLAAGGFRPYREDECWDEKARFDDQTFPQLLLDNRKTIEMHGGDFIHMRKKMNWFDGKYSYLVEPYAKEHVAEAERLLQVWAKDMAERHGMDARDAIASHAMYTFPSDEYFQYMVYEQKRRQYIGYICMSLISESVCGFNASIMDFSIPELYRKMILIGVELSSRLGFAKTNLQGAETKDQFKVKSWFRPERLIRKTHLVYDPAC